METEQQQVGLKDNKENSFRQIYVSEIIITFLILAPFFLLFFGGDITLFFFGGLIEIFVLLLAFVLIILDIYGFIQARKELKGHLLSGSLVPTEIYRLKNISVISFLILLSLASWIFYSYEKNRIDEKHITTEHVATFNTYFQDNSVHEVESIRGDLWHTQIDFKDRDKNGDREYIFLYNHHNGEDFVSKGLNNFAIQNLALQLKIQKLSETIVGKQVVIKNAHEDMFSNVGEVYVDGKSITDSLIPSPNETEQDKLTRLNQEYDYISNFFAKPLNISNAFNDAGADGTAIISLASKEENIFIDLSTFPKNTSRQTTDMVVKFLKDNFMCQWCNKKTVTITIPNREEYIKTNGYRDGTDFIVKLKELSQFYK